MHQIEHAAVPNVDNGGVVGSIKDGPFAIRVGQLRKLLGKLRQVVEHANTRPPDAVPRRIGIRERVALGRPVGVDFGLRGDEIGGKELARRQVFTGKCGSQ